MKQNKKEAVRKLLDTLYRDREITATLYFNCTKPGRAYDANDLLSPARDEEIAMGAKDRNQFVDALIDDVLDIL